MSRFGWLRTAGRGLAVVALAVLIIGGLVTDGQVRTTAFALVAVWHLLGFVVVSLGHAHEASRLPHHHTFATAFVAGCVGGSLLWGRRPPYCRPPRHRYRHRRVGGDLLDREQTRLSWPARSCPRPRRWTGRMTTSRTRSREAIDCVLVDHVLTELQGRKLRPSP